MLLTRESGSAMSRMIRETFPARSPEWTKGRHGMADVYPRKLQLWEGWIAARGAGRPAGGLASVSALPPFADAIAARLFAAEAMQPARGPREATEPFSLQWYLE